MDVFRDSAPKSAGVTGMDGYKQPTALPRHASVEHNEPKFVSDTVHCCQAFLIIREPLCRTCESLRLNIDRFVVRYRAPREEVLSGRLQLMSTTRLLRFGSLEDIKVRSGGYNLCTLVVNSIELEQGEISEGSGPTRDCPASGTCSFNWEVDGREVFEAQDYSTDPYEKVDSPRGLTRRIHVSWNDNRLKDSYLVFLAFGKGSSASDADRAWNPRLLFLGREIGLRGNIQARVKSWIDLCKEKHPQPCLRLQHHLSRRFKEMLSHSDLGVIDVINMQLTELPERHVSNMPEYVALSYV